MQGGVGGGVGGYCRGCEHRFGTYFWCLYSSNYWKANLHASAVSPCVGRSGTQHELYGPSRSHCHNCTGYLHSDVLTEVGRKLVRKWISSQSWDPVSHDALRWTCTAWIILSSYVNICSYMWCVVRTYSPYVRVSTKPLRRLLTGHGVLLKKVINFLFIFIFNRIFFSCRGVWVYIPRFKATVLRKCTILAF